MGTPRASASVDQMRNVQKSANRDGECTGDCAVENSPKREEEVATGTNSSCSAGAINAEDGCQGCGAASCPDFCSGRTHDFIVAQHSHCAAGVGMFIVQVSAGAWEETPSSATVDRMAMANRFCTPRV